MTDSKKVDFPGVEGIWIPCEYKIENGPLAFMEFMGMPKADADDLNDKELALLMEELDHFISRRKVGLEFEGYKFGADGACHQANWRRKSEKTAEYVATEWKKKADPDYRWQESSETVTMRYQGKKNDEGLEDFTLYKDSDRLRVDLKRDGVLYCQIYYSKK
ncbi:hypothetical protein FUAX_07120 [Fulvitalea axinellae]|uniref:Lipocalin-like domain-containing protein n=1 Tax=Fulvitalea axinellae TaxID=1182444 RepID=A0AAU9D7V0_9BACT|nr:hypothetical protein FUAX_07120 [Fulvitalea axinellae]